MSILLHKEVCPYGPLGSTIIKPLSWRILNDNKRFVDDWHTFVKRARQWQRIHPVTLYKRAKWEREKNDWRKQWVKLSQYERDYWFARRRDEGINIFMTAFKSPKYQRGSIGMMCGAGTMTSGEVLSLSGANNTANNIDVSPPSPLRAGFSALRSGLFFRYNSAGNLQINGTTDWITPRTGTIGDDYEIKWNLISTTFGAPNDENYTEDVWSTLSSTHEVWDFRDTISAPHKYEFDIGDNGTSTSDVNQDYSAEAGDLV